LFDEYVQGIILEIKGNDEILQIVYGEDRIVYAILDLHEECISREVHG